MWKVNKNMSCRFWKRWLNKRRFLTFILKVLIRTMTCSFQEALVKYGVEKVDIFQTNDLFEKKDMANVTNTIFMLGRAVIHDYYWLIHFWIINRKLRFIFVFGILLKSLRVTKTGNYNIRCLCLFPKGFIVHSSSYI